MPSPRRSRSWSRSRSFVPRPNWPAFWKPHRGRHWWSDRKPNGPQIPSWPGRLHAWRFSCRAGQEPWPFISRHVAGDWGELDEEDRRENELSGKEGFRILSAYTLSDGTKIWIITEADRSATTILLPCHKTVMKGILHVSQFSRKIEAWRNAQRL